MPVLPGAQRRAPGRPEPPAVPSGTAAPSGPARGAGMELTAGQVAVVTGAASGIGLAMARRFAAEGLRVVLADVEEEPLRAAADELTADGARVLARTVDVGVREEVAALADAAYDTFGAVHLLCNNAGVGSGAEGRMWEHEPNDWAWAFAVNVWGVFHGIQCFVPRMLAGGGPGHVVNTSSTDGGVAPLPTASVYAVTKAAVVTMTESLYAHLKAEAAPIGASVLFPVRTCSAPACGSRTATGPRATPSPGRAVRRTAAWPSGRRR